MKWIGQHIWDFISRFRSDVYLENKDSGTIASGGNLGLDSNNKVVKLEYPQYEKPEKIKSLNFEKINKISGVLNGIKGQYLIFDDGSVLNIRKHNGYYVNFET